MLLLDIGNSRCKWARIQQGHWAENGAVNNADIHTLPATFSALPAPSKIVLSNVAGAAMQQAIESLGKSWNVPLQTVQAQALQCGVVNHYEQAEQLGSDRWAALIAAWEKMQRACLVINCGTATTVDALSTEGEFLGGLILPGLHTMRQSLCANTAQLNAPEGQLQDFPRNTADAMQSGILRATLGAIEYQYSLINKELNTVCLLSGGASLILAPHLNLPVIAQDNLVLAGLKIIGETERC